MERFQAVQPAPFARTRHPGAQWFPGASFGLFMHWGIHCVAGLDPSWAMKTSIPWYTGEDAEAYRGKANYYALAPRFNPERYDPGLWIAAARRAGIQYAVLTAKHHDGYCLWPSSYGSMNTRTYMGGRDLLGPFITACHNHGIKAGLYFSGPDWSYPGFPVNMDEARKSGSQSLEQTFDDQDFQHYVHGQLSELLTRYGKLDLIWFDGGVGEFDKTCAWIRELQPHIVIGRKGDIDQSFESGHKPLEPPAGWWETVMYLGGHWGHAPATEIERAPLILDKLVNTRAWGGNFLMNLGPRPDGTMRPEFYQRLEEIAAWMDHSRPSVIGADAVGNWQNFSAVPITRRENVWYLHVLPTLFGPIQMYDVRERPVSVTLLRTGQSLVHRYYSNRLVVDLPYSQRGKLDEVVEVRFEREPHPARLRY